MGEIEKDVEQRLKKGIKPVELINNGFKKSTVYKIAHELGLTRKGHSCLEIQCLVVKLTRGMFNDVEMVLQEQLKTTAPPPLPPLPPIDPPVGVPFDPRKVFSPTPKTDEERVAKRMMEAIDKFAPGLLGSFNNPVQVEPFSVISGPSLPIKTLTAIAITLPLEDYKKLGSPAIDEVVTLKLSRAKT